MSAVAATVAVILVSDGSSLCGIASCRTSSDLLGAASATPTPRLQRGWPRGKQRYSIARPLGSAELTKSLSHRGPAGCPKSFPAGPLGDADLAVKITFIETEARRAGVLHARLPGHELTFVDHLDDAGLETEVLSGFINSRITAEFPHERIPSAPYLHAVRGH